jgi:virginiamycin B lyase
VKNFWAFNGRTGFDATPFEPTRREGGGRVLRPIAIACVIVVLILGPTSAATSTVDGGIRRFDISGLPFDITAGPDGNIWFTESGPPDRIGRLSPSGALDEFTVSGDGVDEITAGPDGNLWFTVVWSSAIGKITPEGAITLFPIPTPNAQPTGIATGSDGNIWFSEWGKRRIGRMTPQGGLTEFPLPSKVAQPSYMTLGPDGNVWYGAFQRIGRITPTGEVEEFRNPIGVSDMTAGPDGNVWFASYPDTRVGRITPDGDIATFETGVLANGITSGPDGNVWLVGFDGRLARVTPEGTVTRFEEFVNAGVRITLGPGGETLWITDLFSGQVVAVRR